LRHLFLIQAETRDFAADESVVTAVKIQKLAQVFVTGVFQVRFREIRGLAEIAVVIQVHGQEGDLGRHIREPEAFVEFDAVKNNNFVGHADVLQMQIAVAVSDFMLRDTFVQQIGFGDDKLLRVRFEKGVLKGGKGDVDVLFGLREVFFVVVADH